MPNKTIRFNILATICLCSCAALHADDNNVIAVVRMTNDGDAMCVPLQLQEKTFWFLVDTGADVSVIDDSLAEGSVREIRQVGIGAKLVRLPCFFTPELKLGHVCISDTIPTICLLCLDELRESIGRDCNGILGMDFLQHHIVQLDFDDSELRFLAQQPEKCGQAIPLKTSPLRISGIISNIHVDDIILDSGSLSRDSGSINSSLASQTHNGGIIRIGKTVTADLLSSRESELVRASTITIGDITVNDPIFAVARGTKLSQRFLSRFNVIFNFPENRVYLQKRRQQPPPDRFDLSGVDIIRRDEAVIVESVDEGCAGDSAGLQSGDVLVRLGDKVAADTRLFVLREILSTAAARLPATVNRAGKPMEMYLDLHQTEK